MNFFFNMEIIMTKKIVNNDNNIIGVNMLVLFNCVIIFLLKYLSLVCVLSYFLIVVLIILSGIVIFKVEKK